MTALLTFLIAWTLISIPSAFIAAALMAQSKKSSSLEFETAPVVLTESATLS